ncbi:MAG: 3,4-dihydroxy-2-butanone-4-phosphate synthase [Proteobacteria bacterium]|nr:3,4-dihydroxy-2-butanone-4-phosphate synthase [Pseudomonadota bacterium]
MAPSKALSSIEDIIADAKRGKMFILVDDENRENEGDLVIPAEKADASAVNFMAKHGRGLICLSLTGERVQELGLPPMARHNSSRHYTAFTVSIEAREGVTTGISAADRAHTIATAINPSSTARDIVSPGHIFPLEAREGGVLVRAGHTEAAVDISRLAGLNPSGVICEIMNDDGSMARLPDLITFAKKHKLKIATIADLISYRRRKEQLVKRSLETTFKSKFGGEFTLHVYVNTVEYAEHVVLVKGKIGKGDNVWVRMHSMDVLNDTLGDLSSGKAGELQRAMEMIGKKGKGVVVLIREPRRNSLSGSVKRHMEAAESRTSSLRDYGIGAQILLDLGVRDMTLLTNSSRSIVGLEGYGLTVKGRKSIKE